MSKSKTTHSAEAAVRAIQMKSQLAKMAQQQTEREWLDKNDLDRPLWKFLLVFLALFLAPMIGVFGESLSAGLMLLGIILVTGLLALNRRVTALARLTEGRSE